MGLRRQLLDVVLRDLPTPESRVEEPNPRWDVLLGGRKRSGVWGRFSTGYGTTCAIVLDGWMIDAGAPDDMVVTGDTPDGGGTPIFRAIREGATSRGWFRTPVRGQLPDVRPGDIYVSNHTTASGTGGEHTGVIVSVTRVGDTLEIETADGGQGTRDHQYAGRRVRTVKLGSGTHPVIISTPGVGEGWLDYWVAVGGDEPLGDDVAPAPAGDMTQVLLGVLGVAMIAGGAYWYLVAPKARPLFALFPTGHSSTVQDRRWAV